MVVSSARPKTAPPTAFPHWPRLLALLAVVAFVALSWRVEEPPEPLAASAPATAFSSDRAWSHLERITGTDPTPIGSPAGDRIRDHLVAELTRLGLRTEVQRSTGASTFGSSVSAGRVENVIATLPGTAPTGKLLVGAHYDSTFSGPGASDDKASVAAALETARALVAGQRPRNDVVFLLTDGEEPGLLGAAAYVQQHPDGARPGVLLNWEGPGNAGPSALFQTSRGAAGVIAAFAADAGVAIGDSLVPEAMAFVHNHTDLNTLADAGYEGLTFGFVDGRAYYHSTQDVVANFSRASLQQHGASMLALTRSFGDRDLPALFSSDDTTFFTMFGQVVAYPGALAVPLAVLALALVAALGLLARRRGFVTIPKLLAGAALALVPMAVAALLAIGLWELLVALRPGYTALMSGEPYRPVLYRFALGAMAATVVVAWFLVLRRRVGTHALAIGALVWPAALGVALAATLPGMAYVGTVPALLAAIGGIVVLAIGPARPGLRILASAVAIAPAVLVVLATGRTMLQGFGIAMGAVGAVCVVLATLVVLPLLPQGAGTRKAWRVPALGAVLSVALAVAGFAVDRFDPAHPQPTNLMYVLDADTGTARWASSDANPPGWTRQYATAPAPDLGPLPYRARPSWSGPAPAAPLAAPEVTVVSTRPDGDATVVELRLRSARGADVIVLHSNRRVERVGLTGATAVAPEYSGPDRAWPFQLQFYDPPAEGLTVTLRVADPAGLELAVADYTATLAGLPGLTPRPTDLTRGNEHSADLTVVTARHRVEFAR